MKNKIQIVLIIILGISITFLLLKLRLNKDLVINESFNKMDSYLKINKVFQKDFLINYALNINSSRDYERIDYLGEYISDFGYNDLASNIDVYIYNTHQTESYSYHRINEYNINETVLLASYMLREKLRLKGINAFVETTNIKEILNQNNWKYKQSYSASRILINAFLTNNNPKLIIDLHRDSGSYEKTTISIDNVNYAKILFVVGKKNPGFESNYNIANKLNELIKNKNPLLSRGITLKDGPSVNGIYNQDINPNMVLIEIGGEYNTISEVNNTLDILSAVLYDYIKNGS